MIGTYFHVLALIATPEKERKVETLCCERLCQMEALNWIADMRRQNTGNELRKKTARLLFAIDGIAEAKRNGKISYFVFILYYIYVDRLYGNRGILSLLSYCHIRNSPIFIFGYGRCSQLPDTIVVHFVLVRLHFPLFIVCACPQYAIKLHRTLTQHRPLSGTDAVAAAANSASKNENPLGIGSPNSCSCEPYPTCKMHEQLHFEWINNLVLVIFISLNLVGAWCMK